MDEGDADGEADGSGSPEDLFPVPAEHAFNPDNGDEDGHREEEGGGAESECPALFAAVGSGNASENNDDEPAEGVGADDHDGDHDFVFNPAVREDDGGDAGEHGETYAGEESPEDVFLWNHVFNLPISGVTG